MNAHERVKQFAEKKGVVMVDKPEQKALKSALKGKGKNLTQKEKDDLFLQMAQDLGYID